MFQIGDRLLLIADLFSSGSMFAVTVCRDGPAPNHQRVPINSSVRKDLAKRMFAVACIQSGCPCFDLLIN
jgi:hypothetical protein